MEPHFRFRLYILTALIIFGCGTLLTRLHSFQIEQREKFLSQVPGGRMVSIREPGIRGEIVDRNGVALARNIRNYEVSFNLDEIYRAYRQQHDNAPVIERISPEDGMLRKRKERDIVGIVKDWTISTLSDPKLNLNLAKNFNAKALRTHYVTHGGLIPFTYRTDLTYEEFAKFAEHNLDLPGVNLGTRPQREYPYGALASHVLGFVKQWEKGDIPEAEAREFDHYVGDEKGSGGVEETMDRYLRGQPGSKRVAKDEKGVVTGTFDPIAPGYGATVHLTLDANIQLLVENTLRQIGRGAGVVMDVNTGEVLAMASVPDFDLNAFIPSITAKRLADYNGNKLSPFTNRAMTGFAPGSTFKLPTAIAGAIDGMSGQVFSCDGGVAYGNHTIHCWIAQKGGSHGSLTLPMAIKQSCNPYFNKLANAIRPAGMMTGFQMMGFGKPTGVELPNEEGGILPGTKEWLRAKKLNSLSAVDCAFLSIGQGDSMATPLQLCAMVSCIANGGKYYTPRVVKKVVSGDGKRIIIDDIPKLKVDLLQNGVKQKDMDLIRKGMWLAVNEAGGTAGKVKIPNIEVAAKTGTAQTVDNGQKSHNSWVVSFAPFDKPRYALCILVQNGGSGGGVCGPLANMIYQGIFAQEDGMKLPLRPQTEYGGNTNRFEPGDIKLPENVLAAIEATPGDVGETGDESDAAPRENGPAAAPANAPRPTITQEADEEGQVPKAKPVTAPKAKPARGR